MSGDDRCACGHPRRVHHGPNGPCLAPYTFQGSKKPAEATVCPCTRFHHVGEERDAD